MITATVDMTGFTKGLAGLVRATKLSMPQVVRKETGELIKTLVRVSPPAFPNRTRDSIDRGVDRVFQALSDNEHRPNQSKAGANGLEYYAVDSHYLYAIAPQKDMTRASVRDLRSVYFSTKVSKGTARQILEFKHPRVRQRFSLLQKLLTKESRRTQLKSLLKRSVGRLKAGWLVAVNAGAIQLSGGNQPPEWVKRHGAKARGTFLNGLTDPNKPSFTITNFAKGIGAKNVNRLVALAVNIRAKAMAANAKLFYSGKKRLSDYK